MKWGRVKRGKPTRTRWRGSKPHFRGDNEGEVSFTGGVLKTFVAVLFLPFLVGGVWGQEELMPLIPRGQENASLPFGGNHPVVGGDDFEILIPAVTTIQLVAGEVAAPRGGGAGVSLHGLTVSKREHLRRRLEAFIGSGLTERDLLLLTELVVSHYESHDRPVVEVWVPEQEGEGLVVRVQEGRVGQVQLREGRYFQAPGLAQAVRLQSGDLLRESSLAEISTWLSRNPFRTAEVFAAAGVGPGEADLVFGLSEQRPWQVSVGYENTGIEATGQDRFLLGVVLGNAFAADHVMAYQATLGADFSQFQAHGLSWEVPIHRRHEFVRLSASWAEVGSDLATTVGPADVRGTSWQAHLSYGRPIRLASGWQGEFSGGIELKRSDTFLTFGDSSFSSTNSPVDVAQLRVDAILRRNDLKTGGWKKSFRATLIASPGGVTGRNRDEDFAAYRSDAESSYLALRARGEWSRQWEGWTLLFRAEGQLASGALLPSEQLGLGGARTVRGYQEREYLADRGWWVAAEARSPTGIFHWKEEEFRWQGVFFADHALAWQQGGGEQAMLGLGAGVRVEWERATLRGDLGLPLIDGGGLRLHVGLGYRW